MSGIIHFVSGKTLEITEHERAKLAPKLGMKGVRTFTSTSGHIIPLNSNTMEFIELVPEPEIKLEKEVIEKEVKDYLKIDPVPKEDPMEDMLAKSNCLHQNQTLYVQHTAKGIRYFPVCDFCGKRERYVSEKKILDGEYPSWSLEDIENAKPWTKD